MQYRRPRLNVWQPDVLIRDLMLYFASRDLHLSATFARRFYWRCGAAQLLRPRLLLLLLLRAMQAVTALYSGAFLQGRACPLQRCGGIAGAAFTHLDTAYVLRTKRCHPPAAT